MIRLIIGFALIIVGAMTWLFAEGELRLVVLIIGLSFIIGGVLVASSFRKEA